MGLGRRRLLPFRKLLLPVAWALDFVDTYILKHRLYYHGLCDFCATFFYWCYYDGDSIYVARRLYYVWDRAKNTGHWVYGDGPWWAALWASVLLFLGSTVARIYDRWQSDFWMKWELWFSDRSYRILTTYFKEIPFPATHVEEAP